MVNMNLNNIMALAFDKPLEYKSLFLYPAKMAHYYLFKTALDTLFLSRELETDINLLRLPYLEYLYEKSLVDEEYRMKWNGLIYILKITLQDQNFDILRKQGKIYIKVYQSTEYYKLLKSEYDKILEDIKNTTIEPADLIVLKEKLAEIEDKMPYVMLISEDFEELKYMICEQNDIKVEIYSAEMEKYLKETKDKISRINSMKFGDDVTLEDMITAVANNLKLTNRSEIFDMTIRCFNRYLDILYNKDDYYMYKSAILNGNIKMDKEPSFWIKKHKPKGKYDGVLVESNSLTSKFDGNTI